MCGVSLFSGDNWRMLSWCIAWLLLAVDVVNSWPEGTYGLPMSASGCPPTQHTFEWETGSRTHQTEKGSHGSDPIHLAGIYSRKDNKITQSFCMKGTVKGEGHWSWEAGQYCIYALNECPNGFKTGWIYWDDAAPLLAGTFQKVTGATPEGEYGRNTKIFYCCRIDGYITKPIHLPRSAPFHLLKYGVEGCQKVVGMSASEEWVYWSDENMVNLNAHGGYYPKVYRAKYPDKFTKLYYCYYKPEPENDNMEKALMVFTVIGGIAGGFVFIMCCMCIIQRMCKKEYNSPMLPFRENNGVVETVVHRYTLGTEATLTQEDFPSAAAKPDEVVQAADNEEELNGSAIAVANPHTTSPSHPALQTHTDTKKPPQPRRLGEQRGVLPSKSTGYDPVPVLPPPPTGPTHITGPPIGPYSTGPPLTMGPPISGGPSQPLHLPPAQMCPSIDPPPPSYAEVMRQDSMSSPDSP